MSKIWIIISSIVGGALLASTAILGVLAIQNHIEESVANMRADLLLQEQGATAQEIKDFIRDYMSPEPIMGPDEEEIPLGYSVNTFYSTSLHSSITSSTSSFRVSSSLVANDEEFSPEYPLYFMINASGASREIVECWGFSTSTAGQVWVNDCNRGLSFSGGSATSTVSGNAKAHAGGEKVAQTDVHYIFQQYLDLNQDQTISGTKTWATSTVFNTGLGMDFNGTSTLGYIREIGGYLGWADPMNPSSSYLFISGGSGLSASSTGGIGIQGSVIEIDTSGLTNNALALGSFDHAFRGFYSSSTSYLSTVEIDGNLVMASSSRVASDLIPNANNTWDLGIGDYAWRNMNASGTLVIGTDGTIATSTFYGGLETPNINLTGSATNTASNGFDLTDGCYAIDGNCTNPAVLWEYIGTATLEPGTGCATSTPTTGARAAVINSYLDDEGTASARYGHQTTVINNGGHGIGTVTFTKSSGNVDQSIQQILWSAGGLQICGSDANDDAVIMYYK